MVIIPERISIEISTFCNLSCGMCFLTGFRQKKIAGAADYLNKFFDASLFKKIIDELSKNLSRKDLPFSVSLTGGEPFLHPQIFELLRYAREKKVGITVYTNGTLIDSSFARKICEVMPAALMFSVDGPEEIHDKIRGKGNFQKTCEAIKLVQLQKVVFMTKRPKIYINTVINNLNVGYLQDILFLAELFDVDGISFSHSQWSDSRLSFLTENEFEKRLNWTGPRRFRNITVRAMEHNLKVAEDKIRELVSQINLIKERYKCSSLPQAALMPHFFSFRPNLSEEEIRLWYSEECGKINFCDWVYKWIRIGVDGSVQPICGVIPFSFGNLSDRSLKEILANEKTKFFFKEIKSNGFFYACQHCCRRPAAAGG